MNEAKLKACPFCGSQKIDEAGQDGWWQMLCADCHAAGPSAGTPPDARRYWQGRAGDQQPEATQNAEDIASSSAARGSASGPCICASCGNWPARMTPNGLRCHLCECRDYCAANPVPLPSDPQMLKDLASIGVPGAADKLQQTPNAQAQRPEAKHE